MQKTIISRGPINLVGIAVRTNNTDEINPERAKIGLTMQRYFGESCAAKIKARKNEGITFCVYTNYESDATGNYTYFIGEEVTSFDEVDTGLEALTIPGQMYLKCTTQAGVMPAVVISAWQSIWGMSFRDLGGERAYLADFELYDERSSDLKNAIVDIYIGLKD